MIDLHIHSTCSDSSSTVEEILEEAKNRGLSLLSITDHDVIDAYDILQAENVRNIFNGKIISGVEITTTVDGELVEVLGYGFNVKAFKENMKGKFLPFKECKEKEYELTKQSYIEHRIKFDERNINFNPEYESCRKYFIKECFQYPENVARLTNPLSATDFTSFIRNELYNPKSDFYVDFSQIYISFQDAIDLIHNSGGVAFLAHPYVYSKNVINRINSIIDRYNLDGIECYYYSFTEDQTNYLLNLCEKHNLFVSGGSDYHGAVRSDNFIGVGKGNLNVNEGKCAIWTEKLNDYR